MRRPRLDWASLPIHPLLAAAYPVVFLFAANADEQVTLQPLWTPLLFAVGSTARVVLAVMWLLLRDAWSRAALIGDCARHRLLRIRPCVECRQGLVIPNQWPLIGAWVLAVLIGLFAAARGALHLLRAVTRGLNVVAGARAAAQCLGRGRHHGRLRSRGRRR